MRNKCEKISNQKIKKTELPEIKNDIKKSKLVNVGYLKRS